MRNKEKEALQRISEKSLYSTGVMEAAITYCFQIVKRFLKGSSVLELGPAEGVMTERLVEATKDLTVVEGSKLFCDLLAQRFQDITVINALFEEFNPDRTYDTIILGHVLEHVEDPVAILKKASKWLTPRTGRVFAAVPNAHSLHRQAAVLMGLLPHETALNELDIHHGHRRVFEPESFRETFHQAGLRIELFGGYWLKPLSNRQTEEHWTDEMIQAFLQLGEKYPEIAGEIYVVATHSDPA